MAHKKYICSFFAILFLCAYQIKATHLRAGEILAVKKGPYTYEFTLVLYRNIAGVDQPNATINFGDGTSQTVDVKSRNPAGASSQNSLNSETEVLTFKFTKTYSGPSTFTVSVREVNRNGDIKNITNSSEVAFYIETQITIDPLLGANSSPQFLVPPIDQGNINQIYTHAPGAWDPDGDSLSFKIVEPKSDKDVIATGYQDPNKVFGGKSSTGGEATFKIDPVTGLITWDSPLVAGLYNIAFIVEEWRNGIKLGYITRDMQINVLANDNKPPVLTIPNDTCITAGSRLLATITGTDFAFSQINLTAFSGIFNAPVNPVAITTLKSPNPQTTPAFMYFNWQSTCNLIRQQPYQVTFKAEDNPGLGNSLVTEKVWQIKIIAPKPSGLVATPNGRSMELKWQKYACGNTDSIYIMRRACSTDTITQTDSCTAGNNTNKGFEVIGKVRSTDTTFIDNNKGKGLKTGTYYCYYIYVSFFSPQKGFSRPSDPACATLSKDVAVLVGVSVLKTDLVTGEIEIKWTKPKDLNPTLYPPPYQYEVYRKADDEASAKLITTIFDINDTLYADKSTNTVNKRYDYIVRFYFGTNKTLKASSDTASSVKLIGISKRNRITLGWQFSTPWINDLYYIYRITGADTVLLDSTSSLSYTDRGIFENKPLEAGKPYKYYVESRGGYSCPDSRKEVNLPFPILNFSQIVEVYLSDTNKPCPPLLSIIKNDCENVDNSTFIDNKLYWKNTYDFNCDSVIVKYKVYAAKTEGEELIFTVTVTDTFLLSRQNSPIIGCYAVTAINDLDKESEKSNVVCSDNCVYYELPNIFTPNNDNVNDKFTPKETPRYVESVDIKVFNRWGKMIFESKRDIFINWDADETPDGLYFYSAIVKFKTASNAELLRKINGWVQILR